MALRLEVPIRVEVSGLPSDADLARIEQATGDAARVALQRLGDDYLAPRGPNRTVRVTAPSVRLTGPLAGHLVEPQRLRRAVTEGIRYATRASGVQRVAGHGMARPAAAGVAEVVDVGEQHRVRAGRYRLAIFDDGTPGDVPVDRRPRSFTLDDALGAAWLGHLRRFGPVWDPPRFGHPGYYGSFLLQGESVRNTLVYLSDVTAIDGEGWPLDWLVRSVAFELLRYTPETRQVTTVPVEAAMDHWVMTRTDEPATVERLLELALAQPVPAGETPPTREHLEPLARRAANPQARIYEVTDGARVHYVALTPGDAGSGGSAHSPIRFVTDRIGSGGEGAAAGTPEGAGAGAGGRTGSGGSGRPGGSGAAEGEGTVWPVAGLAGETLVCQPFEGEPAVTALASGGDDLLRRIRWVAARLDVEPCGYAGQFVLNAAQLIGTRARAVGEMSPRSSTTTRVEVRPDGSGNNGYLDVQAGPASELRYMHLLGDLATEVVALANQVVNTYLRPENRTLIHTDADRRLPPNAAGWALHMWKAFELERSCARLFAETCRVILLQQLRSSQQAIAGRRARLEEVVHGFTAKLDILGASVVRLSTLRRAIAHADRYHLQGPVASVLAHQPPPRRFGRDEYIEIPAPIHSVPAPILAALADCAVRLAGEHRVVDDGPRTWTDGELQQAVAMRRGVLNATDPLFLQVAHLDDLYTRQQRDHSYARAYLDRLLTEMAGANQEMQTRAAEADQGAFFALEASQYVKAQGGVNHRGLRFDLAGIHDLADRELAPHCGQLQAYIDGVNRAIGTKAAWDDFLAVFSTAGIIALALLCAPLGATAVAVGAVVSGGAGIALALRDEWEAERMERLYRSLEDPEAILRWQDVEVQRLMANLSMAFAIFDVVGVLKGSRAIVASARGGLRAAAERSLAGAARASVRSWRTAVLRNMAGEVMENAVKEAMQATVMVGVMYLLVPVAVSPVLVPWIRRTAAEHGTTDEVEAVLRQLRSHGGTVTP